MRSPTSILAVCGEGRIRASRTTKSFITSSRSGLTAKQAASFEAKYMPEPNSGCWLWIAGLREGYGVFNIRGVGSYGAHRLSFEMANGSIPDGLVVDHKCRVRCCVNPAHLEAVTQRENLRRGINGVLKTHCVRGHQYTPENIVVTTTGPRAGMRQCRVCKRLLERQRRELRRADGAA